MLSLPLEATSKVAKVAHHARGRETSQRSLAAAMFRVGGGAADFDESKSQSVRLAWQNNVGKGFFARRRGGVCL